MPSPFELSHQRTNMTLYTVKCDFLQALGEVSEEYGGSDFADTVLTASDGDALVVELDGLKVLQDAYPGSMRLVSQRISEIAEQRRNEQAEALAERMKPGVKGYMRLAMQGLKSLRLG